MIRIGKNVLLMCFLATLTSGAADRATNSTPDFKEVYEAVRAHLSGAGDVELNRAAVTGFLKELGPKASLIDGTPEADAPVTPGKLVSKPTLFEDSLGYLRINGIQETLAGELRSAQENLSVSNQLKGLVVDLRYAKGTNYSAALATLALFASKSSATLDWGRGSQEAKAASGTISAPVILLVNGETSGAAEAFAALVHETGAGLLIGSRTAGHALLSQDFPLSNGATLRVATAQVKLNNQDLGPVQPDIMVNVSAKDELAFFADAFALLTRTNSPAGTNRVAAAGRRMRLTEAELVRAHKQGLNPAEDEDGYVNTPREVKPDAPVVSDPVLARALDLLKGLAIVRQTRP
ncbi:MAG: S41 family peptidase [Verrucomicrobiota bacterium]